MLKKHLYFFTALFLFLLTQCRTTPPSAPELEVIAMQLHITPAMYQSEETFDRAMQDLFKRYAAGKQPDLVVIPEYTLSFLALIPYAGQIAQNSDLADCLIDIMSQNTDITSLHSLFLTGSGHVLELAGETFGRLARAYNTYIIAGSYFARSRDGGLRNRTLVFDRLGELAYFQDKVFLTEFEKDLLELSSGDMAKAGGFEIDGFKIGLTICRDTYLKAWEDRYRDYDLWIDIKANGARYDKQQVEAFERALPARLVHTPIPYGLTVCLTGRFLDLFWEGESSFIRNSGREIIYLQRSTASDKADVLYLTVPQDTAPPS